MAIDSRFHARRRWSGKNLCADLEGIICFLETVASDDDFLGSNNIAEITSTLTTARDSLGGDDPEQGVSEDLIEHAENLFDALKAKCASKLSQMLFDLAGKVKLESPLSMVSLIHSCFSIDTNLHDLYDYAYEYGLGAKWDKASSNVQEKYDEGMRPLRLQTVVDEHLNPTAVESTTPKSSIEVSTPKKSVKSVEQSPCPIELLAGPPNAAKANKIFDHLIAYYQRQMVKATRTETSDIFRDLHMIKLCIEKLLSDGVELNSTLEQLVGRDKIQAYRAWCLRYEAIWAAAAISEIQKRFQDLKKTMDGQPLGCAEVIYFEFTKELQSLAMEWDCPESSTLEDWNYLVPRFVSIASATKAADDFEHEYLAFQDHAYTGTELTRLWLLVWRTLKAIHFPLPEEPKQAMLPGEESKSSKVDSFAIEKGFFESAGSPSSNQICLLDFVQTGDVNNPQWIEWFVNKYCSHVAKCHAEREKYYWQFSTMGSKTVPAIVLSTLQTSNEQSTPHPEWNMLLHRIVLRLNHLLGDQKVLKRWWHDKETQSLAYLDVNKSSTNIRQRGQGRSSDGAPTTDGGSRNKENDTDASNRPSGHSTLGNPTSGAAGNGGQDGEGYGNGNGGDKENGGRNSKSPSPPASASSSSNDTDQENKTPPADTLPLATKAELDAFARNSTSPGPPQLLPLGPADDEAAAAEVQRVLDELSDSIVINPMASSSSLEHASDQENIIPLVDAGPLATRVLPSAFPYVNYPIGETRASERAQSMQIAREMRQRGIITSGPHVEDVQNIVPQPLRLVPNLEDDVFRESRSPGILRRSISALRNLWRPVPSVRPEPLPPLPPRGSPRRPRPSPLTANRYGTSGVRRARDRANGSPKLRAGRGVRSGSPQLFNSSFPARQSWVRNTHENFPWDSSNQPPSPRPNPIQNLPSVRVGEAVMTPPEAPRDTTAGPPSQSSGIFMDRNTIRHPISPTPQNGIGRTQVTNQNITAATVQGSPERGARSPAFVEHPGAGPVVGAGPDQDGQNDVPPGQWIPQDDEQYRRFLDDDRARVNRGDTARLAAHRALKMLTENDAGDAILMDLYQLLRARYEWGLTREYQFPQHVPGYYRQPVLVETPRMQRYRPYNGGPGTPPGHLNRGPPGRPESDEMYRGASASAGSSPWFRDSRPDLNLLNRVNPPQSWGSWDGGANTGNQNFDLYVSPGDGSAQPNPDQRGSLSSIDARRELLEERLGGNQPSSRGSVSTLSLPSPSHPGQPSSQERIFSGSRNGSRQGSASATGPAGPVNSGGRRASGASSLGQRSSSVEWPQGSENSSQSRSRPISRNGHPYPPPGNQDDGGQDDGNRVNGNQATPTRDEYMQMTVQQLRDKITNRGGDPGNLRQRKADFVQALLDYDNLGNYGDGAQPRKRATNIAPHPTLSTRALRARDGKGKVTRKK
jgi:hypothetical protein